MVLGDVAISLLPQDVDSRGGCKTDRRLDPTSGSGRINRVHWDLHPGVVSAGTQREATMPQSRWRF